MLLVENQMEKIMHYKIVEAGSMYWCTGMPGMYGGSKLLDDDGRIFEGLYSSQSETFPEP